MSPARPGPLISSREGRWSAVAAVGAGGLLGSAARVGIGMMIPSAAGEFPTAVLVVNLTGSFLLGLYLARWERTISRPASLHFWAIGLLGSFTTFSTFTVDFIELAAAGIPGAAAYVVLSMLGGLALALAGHRIGVAGR